MGTRTLPLIIRSALAMAATASLALRAQIDVEKLAGEANPSLVVRRFDGSPAARTRFMATLERCDWFNVVGSADDPDFRLDVRHSSGAEEALDIQVVSRGRGSFALRATAPRGDIDTAVYRGVDALLRKTFGVPGLCESRIAFVTGGNQNMKEIFSCRFDGTDVQRVTHNNTISTEPAWSPDSRFMVYTLYRNNATTVVLVDMVNNRQKRLSQFRGLNSSADISPDGQWVALSLSKDRRVDLYMLEVQSGKLRQVTRSIAVESSPCWSPRGDRLCFVSDQAGNPQLYLVDVSGGRAQRLLRDRDEAVSPDWSPVSNKICFSTRVGGQYVIAVADPESGSRERKVVTRAAGDWESPSWAPDGRHLVCSRSVRGRRELYMVDSWHGRMIPITQNGNHSLPAWSSLLNHPSR